MKYLDQLLLGAFIIAIVAVVFANSSQAANAIKAPFDTIAALVRFIWAGSLPTATGYSAGGLGGWLPVQLGGNPPPFGS